jgi:hypothetical protein
MGTTLEAQSPNSCDVFIRSTREQYHLSHRFWMVSWDALDLSVGYDYEGMSVVIQGKIAVHGVKEAVPPVGSHGQRAFGRSGPARVRMEDRKMSKYVRGPGSVARPNA